MSQRPAPTVEELRHELAAATQRVLGDTIEITDEQWREATDLEGWTRAHVASHLARNADALTRLVNNVVNGTDDPMYASPDARDAEIEEGAGRKGVELQVDLDTSANQLEQALDAVADDQWDTEVQLRRFAMPLRLIPLQRLNEVVLHHVDLGIGYGGQDIPETVARRLLDKAVAAAEDLGDFPALNLISLTGEEWQIGEIADSTEVRGSTGELLCWLTGRASDVEGGETLSLPSFG